MEDNSFLGINELMPPKICYSVRCIHHVGLTDCALTFPPDTIFNNCICPYFKAELPQCSKEMLFKD